MFPDADHDEPDHKPSTRRPSEGPCPELDALASRVRDPIVTSARVTGNKLRIQITGRPRVGTTLTFIELWAAEPGRPSGVVLQEVTASTPTTETASSTYLFTYTSNDPGALQAFADSVVAKFAQKATELPPPIHHAEFGLYVEVTPDLPDQLGNVLTLFKTFATDRGSDRLINVRELTGRRLFKPGPGAESVAFASLNFVLGFPRELVPHANDLPDAVLSLRKARGNRETWEVTFGPFRRGRIDPAAVRVAPPDDPDPRAQG